VLNKKRSFGKSSQRAGFRQNIKLFREELQQSLKTVPIEDLDSFN
jgi:hypothetical protein